jgi:tripartite-type tricarboxylate transporter receptor subunit TctC
MHVPYKGTAPALNDLIAGHIDLMFTEIASGLELHRAGKVRILGIASAKRSVLANDIPTLAEAGVPDFVSGTWNAVTAPPKTPEPIIAKLSAAILDTLNSDETTSRLRTLGMQPEFMSPAETGVFIATDAKRWAEVIKAAGVKAE